MKKQGNVISIQEEGNQSPDDPDARISRHIFKATLKATLKLF